MHWKVFLITAMIVAALVLAGCGGGESVKPTPTPTVGPVDMTGKYVSNASDIRDAADWSKAKTVRIEMGERLELGEMYYDPDNLTFQAGQPYKVELVNVGALKHYVIQEDFFRSVAWRKAQTSEAEIKAPYFTAFELFPGDQVDLYFVPVTPGTYDHLYCKIEGHVEAGMVGTITVTGSTPTSPAPVYTSISQGQWVQDGADRVSAADWDTMVTVEIELGEFFFAPSETHLHVGQPYKLELPNVGTAKHYFVSEGFFQTVALRKVQDQSAEIKAPAPLAVEVFPGEQADLYLIPTKAGTYELICTIDGHVDAGMHGTIIVEAAH